ncbi:UNVERIFIED_CONTAM: 11S globulin seed storage protein Jug r 4 [Sesamum angustifolium]|uniref:11S globulin seed storage protein Jug r 4 n=1 Tax=Sesamum angustifolium TaxID=2727405 RepID=A0AAW2IK65_9LAMI
MEAFNHISGNIDKIYNELTKSNTHSVGGVSSTHAVGGTAYLNLENPDEPYLYGIKYSAMPPTKRYRDMSQLSGVSGRHRFLLDEVDAALDNLNVAKVASFIRSKSCGGARLDHFGSGFQSIVISLKDNFYDKAEALVGVYRDSDRGSPEYKQKRCSSDVRSQLPLDNILGGSQQPCTLQNGNTSAPTPPMCQLQAPLISSINTNSSHSPLHIFSPHSPASNFLVLSFALRGATWQQGQCRISRINAQEPTRRIQAEGGVSEFWDHNNDEFQCAGVSIHRHRLQPRALMLPAYHNAPILAYVQQGRGMYGVLVSGCPETFESSQQQFEEGKGAQRFRDRHQKIGQFREGDILAFPAGAAHWAYNSGDQELIVVVLQDNSNNANQLDPNPRSFFLAGNPGGRGQEQQEYGPQFGPKRGQHQFGNVFRGFDVQLLREVFGVDEQTARSLQGENDQRGHIITVARGLQVISPPLQGEEYGRQEEEPYYGGRGNGLEETICSAKMRENIDKPSRADIYNPRAGRFSTINSLTLPILSFLQLSAARGVLYRNGIMAPHWCVNAHSVIYVTRGESDMQIVNHNGQAVFDGRVREGQVVVVPQNFAVVKRAGEQGCEWVEFNTNDNALINTLSGRTSALRGLPADVIANAYQISREEAERLKYSRQETMMFSGSFRSSRERVASA